MCWNKIRGQWKVKTIIRAFPYGSGFPLQSFLKQKRISAAIPNAISGVAMPRIYLHPPSLHTRTACAVSFPQNQRYHCTCGIAAIFNCHTFCLVWANAYSTLLSSFRYRYIAVAKSCATTPHQKKDATLQPPPPFRLWQYKNWRKLNNIMQYYVFATHSHPTLMQASHRSGCHIICHYVK